MRSHEIGLIISKAVTHSPLDSFEFRNENTSYISLKALTTLELLKKNNNIPPLSSSLSCASVKLFVKHSVYLFIT